MARQTHVRDGLLPGAKPWNPYAYVMPALILMAAMVVYPLLYGVYIGFTNMSLQNFMSYKWVWFRNFINIAQDPALYEVLWRTIVWTFTNVFFHVVIGVWLAILLNRKLPGKALIRVILILPWAIPQYIAALAWKTMFQYDFGTINLLLKRIGLSAIPWLQHPTWAFVAVIMVNVWLGVPFMMMIALGGLQAIPQELYEATDVDGGTGWDKFRHVTLPLLKPVMIPAITLGTVWTFNTVNVIYLVTGGGPGRATDILVSYVYRSAFDFFRYGYAAAFSLVIFLMLLAFSLVFISKNRADEGVY